MSLEKKPDLLEAVSTVLSNQKFHEFSEESRIELGAVDSDWVYQRWLEWFKTYGKNL